jgi:hypothetical protein
MNTGLEAVVIAAVREFLPEPIKLRAGFYYWFVESVASFWPDGCRHAVRINSFSFPDTPEEATEFGRKAGKMLVAWKKNHPTPPPPTPERP